jgi:hypothetical protein
MSSRKLWIWAALGDLSVGLLSFAVHGFNLSGAGSATRNTARFAIIFFLVRAYMAAQFVHFAFVINLHTTFASQIEIGLPQIAISLLGFSLVAATGYTATAVTRAGVLIHTVLLYINWLILALDYPKHPYRLMRLVTIPVFLALLLRHLPKPKAQEAKAAGA